MRCEVVALLAALTIDVAAAAFVDELSWWYAAFEQWRASAVHVHGHNAFASKHIPVDGDAIEVVEIFDRPMDLRRHGEAPYREVTFTDTRVAR